MPFTFVGERIVYEGVTILSADVDTLVAYSQNAQVSPALKTALAGVVTRRNKLKDLQNRRTWLESQIKEISEEQTRIRSNHELARPQSELYKRYVAKLSSRNRKLKPLRAEAARLRALESDASKELSSYIQSLNVKS
jgi:chromosome segregation ATPase